MGGGGGVIFQIAQFRTKWQCYALPSGQAGAKAVVPHPLLFEILDKLLYSKTIQYSINNARCRDLTALDFRELELSVN